MASLRNKKKGTVLEPSPTLCNTLFLVYQWLQGAQAIPPVIRELWDIALLFRNGKASQYSGQAQGKLVLVILHGKDQLLQAAFKFCDVLKRFGDVLQLRPVSIYLFLLLPALPPPSFVIAFVFHLGPPFCYLGYCHVTPRKSCVAVFLFLYLSTHCPFSARSFPAGVISSHGKAASRHCHHLHLGQRLALLELKAG